MITKYKIIVSDTNTIEFSALQDAQNYCSVNSIDSGSIQTIQENPVFICPDCAFQTALNTGYTVPGVSPILVLDLRDDARIQFVSMAIMMFVGLNAGSINNNTPQTIRDRYGMPCTLTTQQLLQILLGYGSYYIALWQTYKSTLMGV
jgi:hypothetical protein